LPAVRTDQWILTLCLNGDSMIDKQRLDVSDLTVGKPLPWNVYDTENRLLLSRGHIVENLHQAEELSKRGLFVATADVERLAIHSHSQARHEPASALRLINFANKRLERLLYNLGNETDVQGKVLDIATDLARAADINPDVAQATVFLNQTSARYAIRHGVDTALTALLVARRMKKTPEESRIIMAAALTMNIGMLRYHDELQSRQEALLTDKEAAMISSHPQQGLSLLRQAGITDESWLSYVLLHHENEDGSGYPLGKGTGLIPQNARILAFADRFCAAVTSRKYRKPLLPGPALRDVLLAGGKASDPLLAAYFIKEVGTHPPGTFVRLENGEIGVVSRNGVDPATPIVHTFIGPRGAPLTFPIQRDTSKPLHSIHDILPGEDITLRFSMQQLWGDEAAS
jgi:HD-GYP domain-containing protein (c-di-GMP phosphodiesterase class II)